MTCLCQTSGAAKRRRCDTGGTLPRRCIQVQSFTWGALLITVHTSLSYVSLRCRAEDAIRWSREGRSTLAVPPELRHPVTMADAVHIDEYMFRDAVIGSTRTPRCARRVPHHQHLRRCRERDEHHANTITNTTIDSRPGTRAYNHEYDTVPSVLRMSAGVALTAQL
jgi:hypothetical protein